MKRQNTQRRMIIRHLWDKGSITHRESENLCGCTRIAAVVESLKRKDAYKIKTIIETIGDVRFARYHLREGDNGN